MIDEWKSTLSTEQLELIQYCHDYWKENGEWPYSIKLAVDYRERFDLYDLAKSQNHFFFQCGDPNRNESTCELTIYGISVCKGADGDFINFIQTLQYMVSKFIENPMENQISSEDLKKTFGYNSMELETVRHMIDKSHIWSSAGHQPDGGFTFNVKRDILKFENINSIKDFINRCINDIPKQFGGTYDSNDDYSFIEDFDEFGEDAPTGTSKDFLRNYTFILMPMGDGEFDEICSTIKEVCHNHQLMAQRVDDIQSSGDITEEILDHIEKAEFIIVDVSKEKPNVYYELGYAHSHGFGPHDLILIAKEGSKLHFDIQNLRVIYYSNADDLRERLNIRIQSLIDNR